jgi:hypothetical protein
MNVRYIMMLLSESHKLYFTIQVVLMVWTLIQVRAPVRTKRRSIAQLIVKILAVDLQPLVVKLLVQTRNADARVVS